MANEFLISYQVQRSPCLKIYNALPPKKNTKQQKSVFWRIRGSRKRQNRKMWRRKRKATHPQWNKNKVYKVDLLCQIGEIIRRILKNQKPSVSILYLLYTLKHSVFENNNKAEHIYPHRTITCLFYAKDQIWWYSTRFSTTTESKSKFTAFLVMKTIAKNSLLLLALSLRNVTPPTCSVHDILRNNA